MPRFKEGDYVRVKAGTVEYHNTKQFSDYGIAPGGENVHGAGLRGEKVNWQGSSEMDGERRRQWQEIAAFDQIKSCWCRTVPQAGYMCDKCQRIFISV